MSANTERLACDLKNVVHDAEGILKDTAEEASEKVCVARQRLLAAVESAKSCYKNAEQKMAEGAKAADKVIRDHPYQSIGIALGVGILLGYIIKRK